MKLSKELLNSLYQYSVSLTGHPDDAYDLLQSGIEKSLKANTSERTKPAYLRTIIRNQFIDQCRRKKIIAFESLEEDNLTLLSTEPLDKAIIDENQAQVLMQDLNPGERECLYLWAVHGYSAADIANETGEPRGTILSRLYRIKKKAAAKAQALSIHEEHQAGGHHE